MTLYLILFLFSSVISFFSNKKNRKVVAVCLIIIFFLFAGTRNPGIDNDYVEYSRLFQASVFEGFQKGYELIFYILPNLLYTVVGDAYLRMTFLTFAFLGVATKINVISKFSVNFAVSIILYFCLFFFGQEFTTIRAGVAAGIYLLMIKDIVENNKKRFFIKLAIAFAFHYSSLVMLPVWFLVRSKLNIKYYYLGLLFSLFILIIHFNILSVLNLEALIPKMKVYTETEEITELNPFNFRMLISFFYFIFFAFYFNKRKADSFFVLLFKMHIISLIVFYLLTQGGMVFSLRSFDLLSIIQVLLFPYVIKFLPSKLKLLGYVIVLSTAVLNLYYILYVSNNIKDYSSWLF